MHENPYKSPDPWPSAEVGREPTPAAKTPVEREYAYRPKWTTIVLASLFFGAGALFFAAMAKDNDRGLIINGIIELSPGGARIFYWALAALSVGLVAAASTMAMVRLTLRQRIAVGTTCITVPRSRWSSEEIAVPFAEIIRLSTSDVSGQRFLKVVYRGGKFKLVASMLPSEGDFDEILAAINQGIKTCRR
jgi:hypothetical protein